MDAGADVGVRGRRRSVRDEEMRTNTGARQKDDIFEIPVRHAAHIRRQLFSY